MTFGEQQRQLLALLDREKFADWLGKQEAYVDEVGLAQVAGACPLARYLCQGGFSNVSVDTTHCEADEAEVDTPRWATSFIAAVDALPHGTPVSKVKALQCLEIGEQP